MTRGITHLSFGACTPTLLGAGGAERSLQGLSRDGLDVVAGAPDGVLAPVERPCGSLGLAAVGSLVAGLTWDLGGLCPWAGILSWGVSPRTFGRSRPRPGPVLMPGGQRLHVLQGASSTQPSSKHEIQKLDHLSEILMKDQKEDLSTMFQFNLTFN